jgi:hypothetical protein
VLLGQILVLAMSAAKRFDAVVAHAWESTRETLRSLRGLVSDGGADLG